MAEWSRVANTTLQKYVTGSENNILRNRKLLAMFKEKGIITFNNSGTNLNKKVRYKRAPMVGYQDGDTLTFSRRDRWKESELDWRGYASTDAMTKKERLMNKGAQQIIDVYAEVGKGLVDDINENFGDEFYVDGNAQGNAKRIHGFESIFGINGALTLSPVGNPSDTYAKLKTDLGWYTGNWTKGAGGATTWPSGKGDAQYDFWSPLVVDYNSALFSGTTHTWSGQCKTALRYAVTKSRRNKSQNGMLDLFLLEDELYRKFCDAYEGIQRIIRDTSNVGLVKLGFTDVINFEGVDITSEFGLPVGVGYGLNFDQMELMSMQDKLFVVEGPDYDVSTKSWRTGCDFFGNLWMNPRFQCKLQPISAES